MSTTYGPDMVNQPPHYKSTKGLEAITVIETFAPGNYHRGNALKYLLRAGKKGALAEDLRKAIWYIEREILNDRNKTWDENTVAPLHPRIEEHLTKMETEGRFAHACPDLDQELPYCTCLCLGPDCRQQPNRRCLGLDKPPEPYDPILPVAKVRGTDDDGRIDVV